MNRATAAAVLTLARSDTTLTVYDGPAPDGARPPYVVLYLSTDYEDHTRLAAATDRSWDRVTSHCVGALPDAARAVADRLAAVFLDHRLTDAAGQIRHAEGRPLDVDESTGTRWWDAVDVWTFTT